MLQGSVIHGDLYLSPCTVMLLVALCLHVAALSLSLSLSLPLSLSPSAWFISLCFDKLASGFNTNCSLQTGKAHAHPEVQGGGTGWRRMAPLPLPSYCFYPSMNSPTKTPRRDVSRENDAPKPNAAPKALSFDPRKAQRLQMQHAL